MSLATSWQSQAPATRRALTLGLAQGMLNIAAWWLLGAQFINFFAIDLGAQGLMVGIVQAVPNLTGVLRCVAPHFINRSDNRRHVCLVAYLTARLLQVALPVLALPQYRPDWIAPLWLLIAILCVTTLAVFLGDVAWLSWYADLVPEEVWGRYFGARNSCNQAVAMLLPVAGGLFVDRYGAAHPESKLAGYAIVYALGIAFGLMALVPLLLVPNAPLKERRAEAPLLRELGRPFRDLSFRRMAWFGVVLYLGAGITQPAFSLYLKKVLHFGVGDFAVFQNLINSIFFIIGYMTFGALSDRFGNRPFIAIGLLGAAVGPLCWIPTGPDRYFAGLFAAYTIWGLGWAGVNLCQQNLMLKLAPRENNAAYIAAYQGLSGLSSGAGQILGGYAFDLALTRDAQLTFFEWRFGAYQIFFVLSFIVRSCAMWFILRVHEPGAPGARGLWRTRPLAQNARGASRPGSRRGGAAGRRSQANVQTLKKSANTRH